MKSIGQKVLGFFLVREDGDGEPVAAAPSAPAAPPVRDPTPVAPVVPAAALARAAAAPPSPSFAEVYRAAGMADDDRERLAKVLDLLASLPAGAPEDVKRTIVAAALQAFGVAIERTVEAANAALAALDAHVAAGEARAADAARQGQARIAALTAEIDGVRREIEGHLAAQTEHGERAAAEQARIRGLLDFFGDDPAAAVARREAGAPRLVRLK